MSGDDRRLVVDTVSALITRYSRRDDRGADEAPTWDPALWEALEELGYTRVCLAETDGGSNGDLGDAVAIARAAGAAAAPVPLPDSLLLGPWALAAAGLPLPARGVVALATDASELSIERERGGWRLRGRLTEVPWARIATSVAALAERGGAEPAMVLSLDPAACTITPGCNLAGEPRDELAVDISIAETAAAPAPPELNATALHARGALARAAAMSGALDAVLDLTVRHAGERQQFGRPLAAFQAVAHQIAVLAGHVAAAAAALDELDEVSRNATESLPLTAIATAKVITSRAATEGSAIAHQIHGAVGTTAEHRLQLYTRRLWSWRDEFGGELEWSAVLGREFAGADPIALWARLTAER